MLSLNQILSNRFKKHGLCPECNQLNTGESWCQSCNAKRLEQNFPNWTSGNPEIDKFIQKHQLEATDADKLLEWIPYEQFSNIEYLAEGGFGKVYRAKWMEGFIGSWDNKSKKWTKYRKERNQESIYVLKSLSNTKDITQEFLHEVANHKVIDDWFDSIVPCYGISQDPKTKNYVMIMEYIEGGNLRKYLQEDYHSLSFGNKFFRLINIVQGLKDIHQKKLVHRDFHSGNILSDGERCFITDLGLSKTTKEAKDGKVMGVLPYVAPEVLTKKSYSKASDIYSFGIIIAEILTGLPPYHNLPHDEYLTIKICQGLRPNLNEVIAPWLLKNLIEKCWDVDPVKRPTANELVKISRRWQEEMRSRKDTEFYRQYLEVEKLIKEERERKTCELLSELYQRYKGWVVEIKIEGYYQEEIQGVLVNGEWKKIQKVKDELYFEFCKKHEYEENSKEAEEKFKELFSKANNLNYEIHPSAVYTSRLLDFKNLPEH